MPEFLATFFNAVKNAEYGLMEIRDAIVGTYWYISENADVADIWSKVFGPVWSFAPYVAFLFLALGVVNCFFGKKLLPVTKFFACLWLGFMYGIAFVAPLLDIVTFQVPHWVMGAVVAVVAAVLCKAVYFAAYLVAFGYLGYYACYHAFGIEFLQPYLAENMLYALVAAIVCIVLAFIFRKYLEMLLTSFAGGFVAVVFFSKSVYDLTSLPFAAGHAGLTLLGFTLLLTLLGMIVQVKTRKRY